jgi:hypothetical protein
MIVAVLKIKIIAKLRRSWVEHNDALFNVKLDFRLPASSLYTSPRMLRSYGLTLATQR